MIAELLAISGSLLIVASAVLVSVPLGLFVAGVVCVVISVGLFRTKKKVVT